MEIRARFWVNLIILSLLLSLSLKNALPVSAQSASPASYNIFPMAMGDRPPAQLLQGFASTPPAPHVIAEYQGDSNFTKNPPGLSIPGACPAAEKSDLQLLDDGSFILTIVGEISEDITANTNGQSIIICSPLDLNISYIFMGTYTKNPNDLVFTKGLRKQNDTGQVTELQYFTGDGCEGNFTDTTVQAKVKYGLNYNIIDLNTGQGSATQAASPASQAPANPPAAVQSTPTAQPPVTPAPGESPAALPGNLTPAALAVVLGTGVLGLLGLGISGVSLVGALAAAPKPLDLPPVLPPQPPALEPSPPYLPQPSVVVTPGFPPPEAVNPFSPGLPGIDLASPLKDLLLGLTKTGEQTSNLIIKNLPAWVDSGGFDALKNGVGTGSAFSGACKDFLHFADSPETIQAVHDALGAWQKNPSLAAAEDYVYMLGKTTDGQVSKLADGLGGLGKGLDMVEAIGKGLSEADKEGFTGIDRQLIIWSELGKKNLTWIITKNPVVGAADWAVGTATQAMWGKEGRVDVGAIIDKGGDTWKDTVKEYARNTEGGSEADSSNQTADQFLRSIRRIKQQVQNGQISREQGSANLHKLQQALLGN
ncbi:MAG: hypothetical protein P4L50_23595 [Anaerolineaceae bacterium]|nr:hypothetical protein [Anaerolineaceae bacterium]